MVFLGFVLIAASGVLAAGVTVENSVPATLTIYGQTVPGLTTEGEIFLAGSAQAVLLIAGLLVAAGGVRRRMRRGREHLDRETYEENISMLDTPAVALPQNVRDGRGRKVHRAEDGRSGHPRVTAFGGPVVGDR